MGTQLLPLCWSARQEEIFTIFQQLLQDEILVDVTLACEGTSLKAHRMILSAYSPFFRKLFLENPCNHPIVIMKDIKYRDLKRIVDFMYHGRISILPDELSEFVKTAETLKVKGILETVSTTDINVTTCIKQQEQVSQDSADVTHCSGTCEQTSPHSFMAEEQADQSIQQSIISDFMTVDVSNTSDESEHFVAAGVKSEPNSDDMSCEKLATSHMLEDSVSSSHYESAFVSHPVIKDENQNSDKTSDENVEVISNLQQEFTTKENLPQFSDVTNQDINLPSRQMNSAESLGVIIREDPTSILHYMPLEHSNLTERAFNQVGATPIPGLKPLDEPTVFSVSNQLHPDCITIDSTAAHTLEKNNLNDWEENNDIRSFANSSGITDAIQQLIGIEKRPNSHFCPNNNSLRKRSKLEQRTKQDNITTSSFLPWKDDINYDHSTDKLMVCEICSRKFSSAFSLARHRATHTGERPFVCEVCGKRFSRRDNFRAHHTIHTLTQPHFCTICKKKFITTSHLKAHMLAHSTSKSKQSYSHI